MGTHGVAMCNGMNGLHTRMATAQLRMRNCCRWMMQESSCIEGSRPGDGRYVGSFKEALVYGQTRRTSSDCMLKAAYVQYSSYVGDIENLKTRWDGTGWNERGQVGLSTCAMTIINQVKR